MDERRPPLGRNATLLEFSNCIIECIWNCIECDEVLSEDSFVKQLCHPGAIGVVHRPGMVNLMAILDMCRDNSPHGSYYTSKSNKQHRCRQMYGLVGLLLVTLRRLASTQKGQERILEIQIHEPRDTEIPVTETEPA
jgi:hypothetical protein